MQVVECVGYVKPAVVELFGQSGHLDLEMLFARRLQAVGGQKRGDAGGKRWRNRLPRTVEKPLRLSGQKIEQVDAEDGRLANQFAHFLFAQLERAAIRMGCERAGVALHQSEKVLRLDDHG